MGQLKVLFVGSFPTEMSSVEDVLRQTGSLAYSQSVALDDLNGPLVDWSAFDLICAGCPVGRPSDVVSALSVPLQNHLSPVFVFCQDYDPQTVLYLMNQGVRRVLPFANLVETLPDSLATVFALSRSAPVAGSDLPAWLAAIPAGLAIVRSRDGACLCCNERMAQLFACDCADLIGQPLEELGIAAELAQLASPQVDEALAAGLEVERNIYTRDRHVKHVRVAINSLSWDGEVCLIVLVHDETLRDRDQQNVRRLNDELERLVLSRTGALDAAHRELAAEIGRREVSEGFSEQLEQILWQMTDIVALCDSNGMLRYLNQTGQDLFSLRPGQAAAPFNFFQAFVPADQRRLHEEVLPYLAKHDVWQGEMRLALAGGRVIPIFQTILFNQAGRHEAPTLAFVVSDISVMKQLEQELSDSRESYQVLAEAAHDLIFVINSDGSMAYGNRFACQTLNLEPQQVEGLPVTSFFPGQFADELLQMIAEVREIDSPVYTEGALRPDGGEVWLGTWLVPIHSATGKLVSILGISRDITEQRKTDEALKRALEAEKQNTQMRVNFFSMTSHQFRTPLSTILLSVELLQRYWTRWDDAKRMEQVSRIEEASRRLHALLENILVISRVESGHFELSPKEVDLVALASRIIDELETNDRHEHMVEFEHALEQILVFIDVEVARRVIENLISNAIKYSPGGRPVQVKLGLEDGLVVLDVSDQGIGIPEADQKRLFEPFQRASNTELYPGTGIGLTIVKKSVELLQGHVFLKSKEGQGTTFVVRFPAVLTSGS